MSGLHSTRLQTSKVHKRFVAEIKDAVRKTGWKNPGSIEISPAMVGAQPLAFPVPSTFEVALGYRGDLRFVQFGYSARHRQFGYSDGGDEIPSDDSLWLWFLRHPVVSTYLPESRYPTLYGVFPDNAEMSPAHCVLLDRQIRKAYVSQRHLTMIFFALMEPEDGDKHTIWVDDLLMSPGTESYKVPPPVEFTDHFRRFFDALSSSG